MGIYDSSRSADGELWADWQPGMRVMVRKSIDDPRHKYSDVIGVIISLDEFSVALRRRDGETVTVELARIVAGKEVPPPPPIRRPQNR